MTPWRQKDPKQQGGRSSVAPRPRLLKTIEESVSQLYSQPASQAASQQAQLSPAQPSPAQPSPAQLSPAQPGRQPVSLVVSCVPTKVAEAIGFTMLLAPYIPKTLVFTTFEQCWSRDHAKTVSFTIVVLHWVQKTLVLLVFCAHGVKASQKHLFLLCFCMWDRENQKTSGFTLFFGPRIKTHTSFTVLFLLSPDRGCWNH